MKFKLDENFGARTVPLFTNAGHDVHTVFQENISGATDDGLFQICKAENRCLVTFDLDFSDVLRFPPEESAGIVVIRLRRNPSLPLLQRLIRQFLQAVEQMPIAGQLWIVEAERIRIHQSR